MTDPAADASATDAEPRETPDVIVLRDVRKEFGSFVAVEHADFAIPSGEFFSMLGPSGCGKTTLLKMIAGFEQPTGGRVLLEGEDVSAVPPYKRNVNTVFQQYALFPHMTIVENVAFGLRSKKVPAAEARSRAMEMLDLVQAGRVSRRGVRPALRRPAAARRPRPGARQHAGRPAARRAARRARPQAARGDAARAQAHPARGRHHVRLRHPRPGRGAHDERPHRGDEPRPGRADRHARRDLRRPGSVFVAGFIGSANLLPGRVSGGSALAKTARSTWHGLRLGSRRPSASETAPTSR